MENKMGLKDHEIAELVNNITNAVRPICDYGCLREIVSRTVNNYLRTKNLKIDKEG